MDDGEDRIKRTGFWGGVQGNRLMVRQSPTKRLMRGQKLIFNLSTLKCLYRCPSFLSSTRPGTLGGQGR